MSRFLRLIDKSEEGHSVSECTSMPDEKKRIVHFEMSLLVDINAKGKILPLKCSRLIFSETDFQALW